MDDGAGLAPGHGGEHLHGQHEGEIDGGGDGKLAQEVHAQQHVAVAWGKFVVSKLIYNENRMLFSVSKFESKQVRNSK